MVEVYNQNNLLKFIYKECDLFETLETEYALSQNADLRREYNSLCKSVQSLSKLKMNPSSNSLNNILLYSKIK